MAMARDIWSEPGLWSSLFGLLIPIIVCLAAVAASRWAISPAQTVVKPPKPLKSLTFRVDDIPVDHADDLDRNLQSIAERDADLFGAATSFVRRSLGHTGKANMCATVTATTALSGKDLCSRLARAGKDFPYSYSCDFDGITTLYEDIHGATVDIIAVPGLGSHPLGSWKSPYSDDVWLRDFLPKDVPNIRVLIYGYDTTLPGSLSKQSIEDLGGILVERVVAFRARDNTTRRPLIFIGHSLGGLLIKEALIRARRRRDDDIANLAKACYALLFFGVPNLGLRNEQLRTMVRGQPNEALMHDLLVDNDSEASTFLKRLADQFSESCKDHYRVMSFFERMLSPTVELDAEGSWRKTGPASLLVTEKSATATGLVAVADEDNIPLNADHSGLVKYSSRGQGDYPTVTRRLVDCVERAKLDVPKRFVEHNFKHADSETIRACMRSLAFEEIDGRYNGIDTAAAGTCQWLLRHRTLEEWTRQHRGLIWIKGKPGAGKSTLMKYALKYVPPLYKTQPLVLSFFFHGRGHELQKSLLGLFRSLLHQLLDKAPGALSDLIDTFDHRRKTIGEAGEKWQWHVPMLQAFFQSSLSNILKHRAVLVFIDALDECGEEPAVQLIEFLKHTLLGLSSTGLQLGVCFSCRHYPIIELDGGFTIALDRENGGDIDTYVRARLSSDQNSGIQSLLIQRAQGVFMWAHLVVDRVLQMKRNGESPVIIKRTIERVPPKLDDLYDNLLQDLKGRPETIRLVQWICFSVRPLTTDELPWALTIDPDNPNQTLTDCEQSDAFITQDNIDKRVIFLSCGLAEVLPSHYSRIIQFVHQSVKDYFIERGLSALNDSLGTVTLLAPTVNCLLFFRCISYFKIIVSSHNRDFFVEGDTLRHPLEYALKNLETHIKLSQPAEIYAKNILDSFGWPSSYLVNQLVMARKAIDHRSWRKLPEGGNLIHFASAHGLQGLLFQIIMEGADAYMDARDYRGRTPLSWAAENGHNAVAKMLLDTGKVDVNLRDRIYGQTPLSLAAENGHDAVVKMLLNTGKVDVNSRDASGQTPLSLAAENGHDAVVKVLLNTGKVDVNSRDENSQTPLSLAAKNGHHAGVKTLLDTGKFEIDLRDRNSSTPLYWAAENGYDAVVKMLLDTGKVDVNSRDESGQTPLSLAATFGYDAVVNMLLDTGKVDVNSRDESGQTPLSLAATFGCDAVVKMLLDTGKVDVNSRDKIGQTALSRAARKGHFEVLSLLCNNPAVNINLEDKRGVTPFMRAVWRGNKEVVHFLIQTGRLSNQHCMDRTWSQAFWLMSPEELDQSMAVAGFDMGEDFFGLRGLFCDLSIPCS